MQRTVCGNSARTVPSRGGGGDPAVYSIEVHYYESHSDYGIFIYHGRYDIPIKTADKERQWESEEVYDFLIAAVGPLTGEYEMHTPPKSWIRKYAQK